MLDRITMRSGAVAAAFVAALALATPSAAAAPKEKEDLAPPASSGMQDASGKVEAKENDRGRTLKVDVKHLQPNRQYEVRRRGGSAPIGTLDTNRKGKGKTKISEPSSAEPARDRGQALNGIFEGGHDDPSGGDGGYGDGDCGGDGTWGGGGDGCNYGGYGGGMGGGWYYYYYYYYPYEPGYGCEEPEEEPCSWYCIEVVDPETGEKVLRCDGEEHEDDGKCEFPVLEDYEFGYADYCGKEGEFASVVMESYTFEKENHETFYLSLMVPEKVEDCWWVEWKFYEVYATQDTGLPLKVESVKDLEGRAFEIRDAEGGAVISGKFPLLESFGDVPLYGPVDGGKDDGQEGDGGKDGGDGKDGGVDESGYTLWIDDGTGALVKAADLKELVFEPMPMYGDGSPSNDFPGGVR